WQRSSPRWREACAQREALLFWPWEKLATLGLHGIMNGEALAIGDVLLARSAARDAKTIAEASRFEVNGVRVVAFEGLHTSGIAAPLAGEGALGLGGPSLAGGDGRRRVAPCRSRGAFSSLGFAKTNGGGGHERAAGFTADLPAHMPAPDPYTHLERLV